MRPPDNAHSRLIIRVPIGFVAAAELQARAGRDCCSVVSHSRCLKGKSTIAPAMVNPM